MPDFGMVPPEITSGRLYDGPGAGSLRSAAGGWSQVAADLDSTATAYSRVLQDLMDVWYGPSATAMREAAAPYVQWLRNTAIQAAQTGIQADVAAAAFQSAYETVVPPAAIAANRVALARLVVTNLFGQNSAAIASTEALYAEMWAQDAAAMSQYWVSSQAATAAVPVFQRAPLTSNPSAAPAAQSAVVNKGSAVPQVMAAVQPAGLGQTLAASLPGASGVPPESFMQALISSGFPFDVFNNLVSGAGFSAMAATNAANHPLPLAPGGVTGPAMPPAGRSLLPGGVSPTEARPVLASTATGRSWGGLSVPAASTEQLTMVGSVRPLATFVSGQGEVMPLGLPVGAAAPAGDGQRRRGRRSHPDDYVYGIPMPPVIIRNPFGG
jgi:hypothetical protein